MRWSKYYLPTYKETPSDAEIPSHKLMLRAGLIKKLTSGVYTFLPLGFRVLKKIEAIVREEMDRIGCQEILMPILHPSELYEETGRLKHFGPELFKLKDRKNRLFALGPTHEEVVTDLARMELRSYRQLPQCLYQILTKFRDEIRPRFGVMRAREFIMKDAYSFHTSQESLDEMYEKMAGAYRRILDRCGLENVMVEADAGKIGGDVNHEFVVLAEEGESEILRCSCGYTANTDRAESLGRKLAEFEPVLDPPEKVSTPGKKTVEEVSSFLGIHPSRLVKTLLFRSGERIVAGLVGGDRTLNETKLMKLLEDPYIEPLDEKTIRDLTGAEVGYSGPVGLGDRVKIVADEFLRSYEGMVVGANENDAHLRGVKMGRDFEPDLIASISSAEAGDTCAKCAQGTIFSQRGVELGHIFKLDVKYSKSMNATFLDASGKENHFIMGCYGFGVSRAVAAAIEQHNDEKGIVWPPSITPFHVILLPLNMNDPAIVRVADEIYEELSHSGIEVLYDDRDLRPGYKFKDADLVGIPLRITLGGRSLAKKKIELYYRREDRTEMIDRGDVQRLVREYYTA
jgi:prolyl-tRNA synthetase